MFRGKRGMCIIPMGLDGKVTIEELQGELRPTCVVTTKSDRFSISVIRRDSLKLIPTKFGGVCNGNDNEFGRAIVRVRTKELFSRALLRGYLILCFGRPS